MTTNCFNRHTRSGCVSGSRDAGWSMRRGMIPLRLTAKRTREAGSRPRPGCAKRSSVRGSVRLDPEASADCHQTNWSTTAYRVSTNRQLFSCNPTYPESVNYSNVSGTLSLEVSRQARTALGSHLAPEVRVSANWLRRRSVAVVRQPACVGSLASPFAELQQVSRPCVRLSLKRIVGGLRGVVVFGRHGAPLLGWTNDQAQGLPSIYLHCIYNGLFPIRRIRSKDRPARQSETLAFTTRCGG